MIVLSGMIGAGKTTLTKYLAEFLGTEAFYESVDDNPILDKFYEDPEQYGFSLQVYFLNKRFETIKAALANDNNVLDRSIYEDALFTEINKLQGNISQIDFDIYIELLNNMMQELKGLPKKAPDLLIYLDADFSTILTHIKQRGRDFEQWEGNEDLLTYYQTLYDNYQFWYEAYDKSPKVRIKVEDYDIEDSESMDKILNSIARRLFDLKGYTYGQTWLYNTYHTVTGVDEDNNVMCINQVTHEPFKLPLRDFMKEVSKHECHYMN